MRSKTRLGPAAGRELEIARILSYIKRRHIQNVVWLTADVHYAAAHYYNPRKAASDDFSPFWEFIAGPLNAGSFGPNSTDATFGPEVVFNLAPAEGQANLSPYAGLQFFGEVCIDRRSREMTVSLKDIDGESVFIQKLRAQRKRGNSHD
ncbi:MAG: alkaline phosphatase D family protein [Candidatus Thiodiazotropha sp.]